MFVPSHIRCWSEFQEKVAQHRNGKWIYRGERCKEWPLRSPLERALGSWGLSLSDAADIEWQMIRDFRRRYQEEDKAEIDCDTLYCLSTMQHHGAPTRLMDWTYSPYVAARFGVAEGARMGAVYCLDYDWCEKAAYSIASKYLLRRRDRRRDDKSFRKLYLKAENKKRFVFTENPFHLNVRLTVQQGLFLCPGDVSVGFLENLQNMMEVHPQEGRAIKLMFDLSTDAVIDFALRLTRMNIDSSALFPGTDGFARSVGERIPLYAKLGRDLGPQRSRLER